MISEDIKDAIKTGYGLNQIMTKYNLTQSSLLDLMSKDYDLQTKLRKRFKNFAWLNNSAKVEPEIHAEPEADTPELALLKQEAKELGIEFSPRIGANALKKRIESLR